MLGERWWSGTPFRSDALLAFYMQASEAFLQRAMALLVASHYRNTPNDLLFLSDAPAHRLFVLTGPVDEAQASSLVHTVHHMFSDCFVEV